MSRHAAKQGSHYRPAGLKALLALTVVAFVATACSSSSTSQSSTSQSSAGQSSAGQSTGSSQATNLGSINLAITGAGNPVNMSLYAAIHNGYFSQNGVTLNMSTLTDGAVVESALASGGIDGYIGPLTDAILLTSKGYQVTVPVGMESASVSSLMARTGSGIKSVAQLKGKKIAITAKGAPTDLTLGLTLRAAGVNPDSVTEIALGANPTAYLSALQNGTVDAAEAYDPIISEALSEKTAYNLVNYEGGQGPTVIASEYFEGAIFNKSFVQSHAALVDAFVKSIKQGASYADDPANRAALTGILAPYDATESQALVGQIVAHIFASKNPYTPTVTQSQFNYSVAYLKDTQTIPNSTSVSYTDVIAPSGRG